MYYSIKTYLTLSERNILYVGSSKMASTLTEKCEPNVCFPLKHTHQ